MNVYLIWHYIQKTGKVMGKLKICANIFFGGNWRIACPQWTLTISCKSSCQHLNFMLTDVQDSWKPATETYIWKKHLLFDLTEDIYFFGPKYELVIFSWRPQILGVFRFSNSLYAQLPFWWFVWLADRLDSTHSKEEQLEITI